MEYILASKSPRRREYLTQMGIPFIVKTAETDETLPGGVTPREGVELLARRKAEAVASLVSPSSVIIAADTLVELDGKPLGKPADTSEAREMLRALSGSAHTVHTGVAVLCGEKMLSAAETTTVYFRPLDDQEIDEYVVTGEPLDKAGAYGIQGRASVFVERIEGNLDNVVGLPCGLLKELLAKMGAAHE